MPRDKETYKIKKEIDQEIKQKIKISSIETNAVCTNVFFYITIIFKIEQDFFGQRVAILIYVKNRFLVQEVQQVLAGTDDQDAEALRTGRPLQENPDITR